MRSVYRGVGIISIPPIIVTSDIDIFLFIVSKFWGAAQLFQASRFRNLLGNMSPPEDNNRAEIYVEVSSIGFEGVIKFVVLPSGLYPTTRTRIDY